MTMLITYFTGTGNTAYIAEMLARRLEDAANRASENPPVALTCLPIERVDGGQLKAADLVVLGFPIYACDAPAPVYEFIRRARVAASSSAGPTPLVLFCTKGFVAGGALHRVKRVAEPSGFRVVGGTTIMMAGSDGLLYSKRDGWYHRWALRRNYAELRTLQRLVSIVERAVLSAGETRVRVPLSVGGFLVSLLLRPLYIAFERRVGGRFAADSRCIGCRKCEEVCPVQNITVTEAEKPEERRHEFTVTFADRCILCLRCITTCPTEAIQIGAGTEGTVRWHGPDGSFDIQRTLRPRR